MEELLRQLNAKMGDLVALYKLLHTEEINKAKAKVLGTGTKKAVYDFCDGQTGVVEIAKKLNVSQPAVSNHLSDLLQAGLVAVEEREGHRFYQKRLER
jgi:DNA-binding transcriptional ArsR family regulator